MLLKQDVASGDCDPSHTSIMNNRNFEIIQSNEHALIGVSPFNSYFSQDNIEQIIAWTVKRFKNIHIFIPDEIYTYTFQALGYPMSRARRKTKKQDNYLINKVVKALAKYGLSNSDIEKKIVLLSHLKKQRNYAELYSYCLELYENNQYFRDGCIATSQWILAGKGIVSNVIDDNITDIAVQYFLAELPLFLDTPRLLNVPSSSFIYKDIPEFLKNIFAERIFVASNQNFLTMKVLT